MRRSPPKTRQTAAQAAQRVREPLETPPVWPQNALKR